MSTGVSLSGFDSPAVGFEQAFEMLEACHERVQRSLALLGKLVDHIDLHGHDAQSRSAAADVLRYFDIAAPLHHDDEEKNVFPLLLSRDDADLLADVRGLQSDHRRMSALWTVLREPLLRWCQPLSSDPIDAATREVMASFRELYAAHIEIEESRVYPAASALMDAAALQDMGQQMRARRQS